MVILAVIPARGGSKGLSGKNLRHLGGLPLIVHTIRAAQESSRLHDFLVSTDDASIAQVAREAGASVPFLRPAALATDEMALWPAIRHAVECWESAQGKVAGGVVVLQPTSPLRRACDIDRCITRFLETDAEICVSVVRTHDSPYFNIVEPNPDFPPFVRPCLPAMIEGTRRQDRPVVYALNGAVYVVQRSVLTRIENQFRFKRLAVYEMPRIRSIDIDDEEDLNLAEMLLTNRCGHLSNDA